MTFRTPKKFTLDMGNSSQESVTAGTASDTSGLSGQRVRRSIGEWEIGQPSSRASSSPPQPTKASKIVCSSRVPDKRHSTEANRSTAAQAQNSKAVSRVSEARALVVKAKLALSQSRNLKTDIKNSLMEALDGLYKLVKGTETAPKKTGLTEEQADEKDAPITSACPLEQETRSGESLAANSELRNTIDAHMKLLIENTTQIKALKATLDGRSDNGVHTDALRASVEGLVGEVHDLRRASDETVRKISALQDTVPTYAEVLAKPNSGTSPTKLLPKHSIIVSSANDQDTSEEVLGKVRQALDAKTNGLKVTRVRKIKDQKVVISCSSKDEMSKLTSRLAEQNKNLKVEEAVHKDPLIIIKNLLSINKDDDILSSLRNQNAGLLADLSDEDLRAVVKYRRRARNPHESHVILQVTPKLWQKLVAAKKIHIDLQYVLVQDQSPLIQCTRCLGYGHGRKLCKEPVDMCSYCAGPHLRADCPSYLAGETPTCRNCNLAKSTDTRHNAFDGECPIKKRWDAIARASVAYC